MIYQSFFFLYKIFIVLFVCNWNELQAIMTEKQGLRIQDADQLEIGMNSSGADAKNPITLLKTRTTCTAVFSHLVAFALQCLLKCYQYLLAWFFSLDCHFSVILIPDILCNQVLLQINILFFFEQIINQYSYL
jgi:hypothetical protein